MGSAVQCQITIPYNISYPIVPLDRVEACHVRCESRRGSRVTRGGARWRQCGDAKDAWTASSSRICRRVGLIRHEAVALMLKPCCIGSAQCGTALAASLRLHLNIADSLRRCACCRRPRLVPRWRGRRPLLSLTTSSSRHLFILVGHRYSQKFERIASASSYARTDS